MINKKMIGLLATMLVAIILPGFYMFIAELIGVFFIGVALAATWLFLTPPGWIILIILAMCCCSCRKTKS